MDGSNDTDGVVILQHASLWSNGSVGIGDGSRLFIGNKSNRLLVNLFNSVLVFKIY